MFLPLHLAIARQRHQDMLVRVEHRRIANVSDDAAKRSELPAEVDRVPLSATPDGLPRWTFFQSLRRRFECLGIG